MIDRFRNIFPHMAIQAVQFGWVNGDHISLTVKSNESAACSACDFRAWIFVRMFLSMHKSLDDNTADNFKTL